MPRVIRIEPMGLESRGRQHTYVVLGMHRSATSMLALALACQGIEMRGRNQHHEDVDFMRLNDEILKRAGGTWYAPPAEEDILAVGNDMASTISAFVDEKKKDVQLWGWKEPRTSLTIRLFHPLLDNPYYIWIRRNPLHVARSLQNRDKMPIKDGVALAREYTKRIMRFMQFVEDADSNILE